MTESNRKQTVPLKSTDSVASLQLLLFVDERPSSRKQIEPIHSYLESLKGEYPYELMVIEVTEQPYLVEHFRLVATPALIKIYPEPRQTLAGSNLSAQLRNWLPRWQRSLEELLDNYPANVPLLDTTLQEERPPSAINSILYSAELIQLSDEIFRLKQEKEELIEQLKFKDQVLGMLAHDLRSPLTVASIAMETIELDSASNSLDELDPPRRPLTPVQKKQILKQARKQFRIMDRMIADILETKGASAELKIQPHKVQFGEFCQEVLLQMQERFNGKAQQVKTDIPQD